MPEEWERLELINKNGSSAPGTEVSASAMGNGTDDLRQWADQLLNHLGKARHQMASLAAQQGELLSRAVNEGIELVRTAPTPELGRVASESLTMLEEARQTIASVAEQPTRQVLESATDLAGAGAATALQTGRRWLDQLGKKNDEIANSVRADLNIDKGTAAAELVDFSQQVVSSYILLQKGLIELGLQIPFIRSHVEEQDRTAVASLPETGADKACDKSHAGRATPGDFPVHGSDLGGAQ